MDSRLICVRRHYYYICIPIKKPKRKVPPDKKGTCCAIDAGVRTFATVYDPKGEIHEVAGNNNYGLIVRLSHHIDNLQSRISKATGKAKRKMKHALQRMTFRIQNLVKDMHNKVANWLCSTYETILLPAFEASKMVTKATRKINSQTVRNMLSWRHFGLRQHLSHKAEEMGNNLLIVTEEYTSKTCGECGWLNNSLGGSKIFHCKECYSKMDRDHNGARNILLKYLTELM